MIIDEFTHHDCYPLGPAWVRAIDFLQSLDVDAEEKRYVLEGNDLYAAVESYDTKLRAIARPEAHRRYVDIQMLLTGVEKIDCWPMASLTEAIPYDEEKDIAFYDQPATAGSSLQLVPGRFAVFFPHDAHMPGLQTTAGAARVKKVVIKIATQLLP